MDNCVVCEKGIFENWLLKDNFCYDVVNLEIEEIKNLVEMLKYSELVYLIFVWRKNMIDYFIVVGYRCFYVICFFYGGLIKVKVKIYVEKLWNFNVFCYIENFFCFDLILFDVLNSYVKVVCELESLEGVKM